MIYLDSGATSFRKPSGVSRAVQRALETCANPGRGGYRAALEAANTVFRCREAAAALFERIAADEEHHARMISRAMGDM